jgi:DNA polymerase-3 subunit epsilon
MTAEPKIIIVDCQTTGSSTASSSLLELGWNDQSWIVAPSKPVSNRALRLIGIDPSELESGITPQQLWLTLDQQLKTDHPDFAVAHFARFELVYLDRLWREFSEKDFPIPLICTHQIAKRLFPNLPS